MQTGKRGMLILIIFLFNALFLFTLSSRLTSLSQAQAAPSDANLALCFVETTGDAATDYSGDAAALQAAIDASAPGTMIRVAGECTGVQNRNGLTLTVYISKSVIIKGGYTELDWTKPSDPELYPTTISAGGKGNVVLISDLVTVTLDSLVIENGNSAASGLSKTGAGLTVMGTAHVQNSTIRNNKAVSGGGGIFVSSDASLIIFYTTVYSNSVGAADSVNVFGGGIFNYGTLDLFDVTISGNSAYAGGGLANRENGIANLNHVTINDNTATKAEGDGGGGIFNSGSGVISMMNSIIANSPDGIDCVNNATLNDEGYNLVQDGTCIQHRSSLSGDPNLGPLWDNGGATLTHLPRAGSPAVDVIPRRTNGCGSLGQADQRHISRPQNNSCDIGAVEIVDRCFVEANGDAATDYASEDASAVQAAVFDASPFSLLKIAGTCSGVQQIGFYTQTVVITESVMLQGGYTTTNWLSAPDSELYPTILDAQGAGRVIYIEDAPDVSIDRLTLSNGFSSMGSGLHNDSTGVVTVTNTILKENISTSNGGGLANEPDATLNLLSSTVENNQAVIGCGVYNSGGLYINQTTIDDNDCVDGFTAGAGGGIYNTGMVLITNSTISNNSASASGGGVYNLSIMELINTTVSNNTHYVGGLGGGLTNSGDITITFSTISDNWAGLNNLPSGNITMKSSIVANTGGLVACFNNSGVFVDLGYNLIEDGSCITAGTSLSGNPGLGILQDNGGSTKTQALLPNSPVIDMIPFGVNGCGDVVGEDQRGVVRPIGSDCDLGAFEFSLINEIFLPTIIKAP